VAQPAETVDGSQKQVGANTVTRVGESTVLEIEPGTELEDARRQRRGNRTEVCVANIVGNVIRVQVQIVKHVVGVKAQF
jgi:hypothetical protein